MKQSQKIRMVSGALLLGAMFLSFQNCGSNDSSNPVLRAGRTTVTIAQTGLSISPLDPTVAPGFVQSFNVSGGTGPYTLTSDCGSVNGLNFIAPMSAATCTLTFTDGSGKTSTTGVSVAGAAANPLVNSFATSLSGTTETVTISTTGGTGPYTYKKKSGAGTLTNNVYVSSSLMESAIITVSDSTGASLDATVVIDTSASAIKPIYLGLYNNDFLMTPSETEITNAHYFEFDKAFSAYTTAAATRTAITRCRSSFTLYHSMVVGTTCGFGSTPELTWYVNSATSADASVPIYFCQGAYSSYIAKNDGLCAVIGGKLTTTPVGYVSN